VIADKIRKATPILYEDNSGVGVALAFGVSIFSSFLICLYAGYNTSLLMHRITIGTGMWAKRNGGSGRLGGAQLFIYRPSLAKRPWMHRDAMRRL
jgi:hypothetical protein